MGTMNEFTFGDTVRIKRDAPSPLRQGEPGSIVAVSLPQDRQGSYYDRFPSGVVYTIEYSDGESVDVHESLLDPA
jgi:hypothetical protein